MKERRPQQSNRNINVGRDFKVNRQALRTLSQIVEFREKGIPLNGYQKHFAEKNARLVLEYTKDQEHQRRLDGEFVNSKTKRAKKI